MSKGPEDCRNPLNYKGFEAPFGLKAIVNADLRLFGRPTKAAWKTMRQAVSLDRLENFFAAKQEKSE